MKILLLEDDPLVGEIIHEHLIEQGHEVTLCSDGLEAETAALSVAYDLWIFDVNVPQLNGFELLKGLRQVHKQTPAIYITALNQAESVKQGFDSGADDYLKKPFEMVELDARVGYIQKRLGLDHDLLRLGERVAYDPKERTVTAEDTLYRLSFKENRLLHFLITHPNRVYSHEALGEIVWEDEEIPTDGALRTYIKKLRQIIGKEHIVTVHKEGYKYEA